MHHKLPAKYPPFCSGLNVLTHCGLVTHMGTEIWVNIGSGNGLLPDGTKPLPEPMLTDHQWSPVTFISGQFHKRCLNHQSLKTVSNYMSKISFKSPRGQWVNHSLWLVNPINSEMRSNLVLEVCSLALGNSTSTLYVRGFPDHEVLLRLSQTDNIRIEGFPNHIRKIFHFMVSRSLHLMQGVFQLCAYSEKYLDVVHEIIIFPI